ncbi:unnamed protein product [Caenorhabditis brenneri]
MSWLKLATDLKKEIVELLDYESRCNLRSCSKTDKEMVDSTKPTAKKLRVMEIMSDMAVGKTIVRFDIDGFTIWFTGRENVTRIDRGWNGEMVEEFSETKQRNRFELIGEFVDRFNKKGLTWVDSLVITSVRFAIPEAWNIKCHNLILRSIAIDHYMGWYRKLTSICKKFKHFEQREWGDWPESSQLVSEIQVTESFYIDHQLELTDEQLENIEAIDLEITSVNFTTEAAKKRLEKLLRLGNIEDQLMIHIPLPENFDSMKQIIPEEFITKKINADNLQDGEYKGKIIGGFKNIHGIQDPRELEIEIFGDLVRVYCKVYRKEDNGFLMYPF